MLRLPALTFALAATLGLAGCGTLPSMSSAVPVTLAGGVRETQEVLGGGPLLRSLSVSLFDAPLPDPHAQVNIALVGIDVTMGDLSYPFQYFSEPETVDLIQLQTKSADFKGSVPAGNYTGLRFFVDTAGCSVVLFGRHYPIVWAAPGHTNPAPFVAVDAALNFTVGGGLLKKGGPPTKISLDFNLLNSIRFVNGTIYIQPAVSGASQAAQVRGQVVNRAGGPVSGAAVLALDAQGRTVNFSTTAADGSYTINALPPGAYTITVRNSYLTAVGTTLTASGYDAKLKSLPSSSAVLGPNDRLQLPALTD